MTKNNIIITILAISLLAIAVMAYVQNKNTTELISEQAQIINNQGRVLQLILATPEIQVAVSNYYNQIQNENTN